MARPIGSKNGATIDFCMKYDQLAQKICDPVEVLFKLAKNRDPKIRQRAASTLVNKRFPNQVSVKPVESQGELTFTWATNTPDHANHNSLHATQESGTATHAN